MRRRIDERSRIFVYAILRRCYPCVIVEMPVRRVLNGNLQVSSLGFLKKRFQVDDDATLDLELMGPLRCIALGCDAVSLRHGSDLGSRSFVSDIMTNTCRLHYVYKYIPSWPSFEVPVDYLETKLQQLQVRIQCQVEDCTAFITQEHLCWRHASITDIVRTSKQMFEGTLDGDIDGGADCNSA